MATIDSLNTSISELSNDDFYKLLNGIRNQRRVRPTKAIRAKSAPAKTKRAPNKKNLKPQDIFAYAQGLTDAQKLKLFEDLTK